MKKEKEKEEIKDLYLLKRKMQRDKRDIRKKVLGIDEDHTDTSMQRIYGEATKTRRALKVELFGSKSKASATKGEETSIEAFVREALEEVGVKFIEQKAIRYINVDFFLPEHNVVIQVEGCYWHACPVCYPLGPKNMTQRKNVEKDKQTDEIIKEFGSKMFKIWGHELKENKQKVLSKLLEKIHECN